METYGGIILEKELGLGEDVEFKKASTLATTTSSGGEEEEEEEEEEEAMECKNDGQKQNNDIDKINACETTSLGITYTSLGKEDITSLGKEDITSFGKEDITSLGKEDITSLGKEDITSLGKEDITSLGKEDITSFGKEDITSLGKEDITSLGKEDITSLGKEEITSLGKEETILLGKEGIGKSETTIFETTSLGNGGHYQQLKSLDIKKLNTYETTRFSQATNPQDQQGSASEREAVSVECGRTASEPKYECLQMGSIDKPSIYETIGCGIQRQSGPNSKVLPPEGLVVQNAY